jgi:uncharacterized protein YndB with AHSA1/START domain
VLLPNSHDTLRCMSADPLPDVHWPPGWGPDRCDSFVSHERYVPAPVEAVFDHLVALEHWPAWQYGVERIELSDELGVGSRFTVVARPHILDGIVGELVRPTRFGWAAVGDGLSFYQSWLLLTEAGGSRVVFQEASRGPGALLQATMRPYLTGRWLASLPSGDRSE